MVTDEERRAISKRTKDALAAKARWYACLNEAQREELRALGKPTNSAATRVGLPKSGH